MALLALLAVLLGLPAISMTSESSTAPAKKPAGQATLRIIGISPVTVTGRAFKAGERVRITADGRRKFVRAGGSGAFKIAFPEANACNGVVVAAVGSEGSRATVAFAQFSNVHCLEPSAAGSVGAQSARKPALRIVLQEPLTVRGDAFSPGERVRLIALGSIERLTRTTTANAQGAFRASFVGLGADRCSPLVVAAVGSKGSRVSAKVMRRPCKPPRVPPPRQ